jgi:hypothetical protein
VSDVIGSTGAGSTTTINGTVSTTGSTNIDASPSTGGTNVIGNTTSTTDIYGNLTLEPGTTLTLPSGSVTNADLAHSTIGTTSADGSITVPGTMTLGDAADNFVLNLANNNSWTGNQLLPANSTQGNNLVASINDATGGSLNGSQVNPTFGTQNLSNSGNAQIGTGASTTNTFGTGNGDGNTIGVGGGTPSTTTINGNLNLTGAVDFTGSVTLPSGSVTLGSISVATGDIVMGVGGVAAPVALTGDITIPTTGITTVNSVQTAAGPSIATAINTNPAGSVNGGAVKIDATLQVGAGGANKLGVDLTHANTWTGEQTLSATGTALNVTTGATFGGTVNATGQTTLGSTAFSAVTVAAPSGSTLNTLTTGSSYFLLTVSAPETYTAISGANATAGQVIVLVNTSTTPGNYVTFTNGAGLPLNGSPVIVGDGGSVTLLYDASVSGWRMIGAQ